MKSFVREITLLNSGRLDRELRSSSKGDLCYLSRNSWRTLFSRGLVVDVEGRKLRAGQTAEAGKVVRLLLPSPALGFLPFTGEIEFDERVVAETDEFLVWNKSGALPTLPNYPWESNSTLNQIYSMFLSRDDGSVDNFVTCSDIPNYEGGLVQRLDNQSSGLLIVAKERMVKERFQSLISSHQIQKSYLVIVLGECSELDSHSSRFSVHAEKDGKTLVKESIAGAITKPNSRVVNDLEFSEVDAEINVLSVNRGYALVQVKIQTGQRHVVRAIMASLGYPLTGDEMYQNQEQVLSDSARRGKFYLHAHRLLWQDADSQYTYSTNPPDDFIAFSNECLFDVDYSVL